jgi:hypothetical protein
MTSAKKVVRKLVVSAMPIGESASTGPTGSKEMKHVAVVIETKCGSIFSRHYHYNIDILEIDADMGIDEVKKHAVKAVSIISKFSNRPVRLLDVQEVEISTQNKMKDAFAEFMSTK